MQNVFIRKGHGYEEHSTQGRCTAFDGFEIVAAPLHQEGEGWKAAFGDEARAARIYRRDNGRGGTSGTDYGSHAIKLGRDATGALFILMHHGGGREVWHVPRFYDGGDLAAHIVALPERLQYALLYTLYQMASEARRQGQDETRHEWAQAIADGRIRKKRATKTRGARIEIIPQWEIDLKKGDKTGPIEVRL